MIHQFKLLRNIGTFESECPDASIKLKRLVLLYAENGSGKTTIAAILHSLRTGEADPILERKRLGSTAPPHVVLDCDGEPRTVVFEHGTWNRTLPLIRVFDDNFVDRNVYSGLSVDSEHRQNLHSLILGEKGVTLNEKLTHLVSRVTEHNNNLQKIAAEIPAHALEGLTVEEICNLPSQPDVENQIDATARSLQAAEDHVVVMGTPKLDSLSLPSFDVDAIHDLLHLDFSGLITKAESIISAHFDALGPESEKWVESGMRRLEGIGDTCPFCGQSLDTSTLLDHYRSYFNEQYISHKENITTAIELLRDAHSDGRQAEYEFAVRTLQERLSFWRKYTDCSIDEINTQAVRSDWKEAYIGVANALESKRNTPLDKLSLPEGVVSALSAYGQHQAKASVINGKLNSINTEISRIKSQAQTADSAEIKHRLSRLRATKARHSSELASICESYLSEVTAKASTEADRDSARRELADYRNKVFPSLQTAVNEYLTLFNAGFRIDRLIPTNTGTGGGSSTNYDIVINKTPVTIGRASKLEHPPSFENTLSAGDRNTLALAFFFATLYQEPDLGRRILVIDDPVSSLDEHRFLTTAQEVRKLARHALQVIVLSHSKPFLCRVWDHADKSNATALQILRGEERSTISSWDVNEESLTEHDRRHKAFQNFLKSSSADLRQIAQDIRHHLEGYLRVVSPAEFPPGQFLSKSFMDKCWKGLRSGNPILTKPKLQELHEILEYANLFHHDTNPAWQSVIINAGELRGFVNRTLAFVGP